MINAKQLWILVGLASIVAVPVFGDVLVVGSKTHSGTFEGYAGDTFRFRLSSGKALNARRMSVKKLALKKPLKGTLTQSAKPTTLSVSLIGYQKAKFVFHDGKSRRDAIGMRVKSFSPERDPRWAVPGAATEKIPKVDISRLETRQDLTPEQPAVLDRYKTARHEHDAFVAESSRLVAELDGKRGARRSKLLEMLRRRKQDEQSIKQALREATDDLLAVFPSRKNQ